MTETEFWKAQEERAQRLHEAQIDLIQKQAAILANAIERLTPQPPPRMEWFRQQGRMGQNFQPEPPEGDGWEIATIIEDSERVAYYWRRPISASK